MSETIGPCVVCHAEVSAWVGDGETYQSNDWRCDECGRLYCKSCFRGVTIERHEADDHLVCLMCLCPCFDTYSGSTPSIDAPIERMTRDLEAKLSGAEPNPK